MKKFIKYIAIILVLVISVISVYMYLTNKKEITEKTDETLTENNLNIKETITPEPEQSESCLKLKNAIENKMKTYEGEWSVYVEDLKSGEQIIINNKKMVSASLIKLFIMAKVYEEIESQTIAQNDVSSLLHSMITISDNEASNVLVAKLGGGEYTNMYDTNFQNGLKILNTYLTENSYSGTEQQRDMKNSRPNPISEQNYTSVLDCGTLLKKIYKKELVSSVYSDEMLSLLKKQTRTAKIPAGIPQGVACANKTGELSDVENDVAIVFSPGTDYIICVMSNNVPNTSIARANIVHISEMVYKHFNGE